MKILLVDDDTEITQLISRRLKRDNYVVEIATDGECAVDLLQASPYSLILLDLMLPKLSGIEVCQALRKQGNQTPVLMLTGQDDTRDKVSGLDAGADDYLVKPFELDELTARVRALLRRNSEVTAAVISYGALQFDTCTQIVTFLERPVSLRPKELAILELMLRYPTQVFAPNSILDQLWDLSDCPGKATVKSHIRSLRKHLEAVGANNVIETVYGQGYRLNQAFLAEFSHNAGDAPNSLLEIEDNALEDSNQDIIDETWEQVQMMSWHRLSRLEALVNACSQSVPDDGLQQTQSVCQRPDYKAAIAIAHQLKGTLGSFRFQAASLQAKHIEELLSASCVESNTEVDLLQDQVSKLQYLLRQHMIDSPKVSCQVGLPSMKLPQVLVATRDHAWAQDLQQQGQDGPFQIEICSPLDISNHLLEETPTAILLELSQADRHVDLSLLDALVSNYGDQVPILMVIESQQPDEQLVAIHRGARAIALKTWSIKTLLTIIAEYTTHASKL